MVLLLSVIVLSCNAFSAPPPNPRADVKGLAAPSPLIRPLQSFEVIIYENKSIKSMIYFMIQWEKKQQTEGHRDANAQKLAQLGLIGLL